MINSRNEEGKKYVGERLYTDEKITRTKLREALQKLKNDKILWQDRITIQIIWNIGEMGKELLLEMMNKAWMEEDTLQGQKSIIKKLFHEEWKTITGKITDQVVLNFV